MTKRIGFACHYMDPDADLERKSANEVERELRLSTTTASWLNANKSKAEDRLWSIMEHNCIAVGNLLRFVVAQPRPMHMVRISSNFLPVRTHPKWAHFYTRPDVQAFLEKSLGQLGKFARRFAVKLSSHPSQYIVLNSDRMEVREKAIIDFEAEAEICRYLGFGVKKLDMKCNVHLTGRGGPRTFRKVYSRLSPEARNVLTLENDERSRSIDHLLQFSDIVGIVLDIHHHWNYTRGEYIECKDDRLKVILDSWQGLRPTIHYSCPREEYLSTQSMGRRPDYDTFRASGIPRMSLFKHSLTFPNAGLNNWALTFLDQFDIMCEAKAKNIASYQLYEFARTAGYL